jgi:hypothetical protein
LRVLSTLVKGGASPDPIQSLLINTDFLPCLVGFTRFPCVSLSYWDPENASVEPQPDTRWRPRRAKAIILGHQDSASCATLFGPSRAVLTTLRSVAQALL